MMQENPDLAFYFPQDQGFNMFIDAACIPDCCTQKEAAELFINFLCDPEISGRNMDSIGYSTPISNAKVYIDPEMTESEQCYPSGEILENATSFAYLPEEIIRFVESLFLEVRNN